MKEFYCEQDKRFGWGKCYRQCELCSYKEEDMRWLDRHNDPVVCDNPLHNTQVEADGRCHWCEGKELI